jgi:hypothetical protein
VRGKLQKSTKKLVDVWYVGGGVISFQRPENLVWGESFSTILRNWCGVNCVSLGVGCEKQIL